MNIDELWQKRAMSRCRMSILPTAFGDGVRGSGDAVCKICGNSFREHPMDLSVLSYDNRPFLNLLCSGERVKL